MDEKTTPLSADEEWIASEDRRLLRLVGYGLLAAFFIWIAWRVR